MTPGTNMREVVERLRAEGSEAMRELVDLDRTLGAFLKDLEGIAPTVQELHLATIKVVQSSSAEALAWNEVNDRTSRLSAWVCQFLVAFQQLQSSVQAWEIADARRDSTLRNGSEP
jgi:hypothetical protein